MVVEKEEQLTVLREGLLDVLNGDVKMVHLQHDQREREGGLKSQSVHTNLPELKLAVSSSVVPIQCMVLSS